MKNHYPFELKPLPYAYDALEPFIDAKTVEFHHDKHVQTYIDNLNKALTNYPDLHNRSLESLLYNLNTLPNEIQTPVKNNGGGVYNHNIYFDILGSSELKGGKLLDAINSTFGSLDKFKEEIKGAALTVFGSGWASLASDKNGNLQIVKSFNQETLIPQNLCSIIPIDVWEHSYYLKYQNRRAEYLDNILQIINWETVEKRYSECASTDFSQCK